MAEQTAYQSPHWTFRHRLLLGSAKILAIAIPLTVAYAQYLDNSVQDRIDRSENALAGVSVQLEGRSGAVRSAGIRTLYVLAFREVPVEPEAGWYAPFSNLFALLKRHLEYRMLERCRTLFREYARSERAVADGEVDQVSTTIATTARQWINQEVKLLGADAKDPRLWFFFQAHLPKAYIPGMNLRDLVLANANLNGAQLNGSHMEDAYMPNISLEGAKMESCYLGHATLRGANLNGAVLSFADLRSADLSDATLIDADLTGAKLDGVVMVRANLSGAILQNVSLRGADLRGADLTRANLSNADLKLADLQGASLGQADLRFVTNLTEAKNLDRALLDGALLPENSR